MSANFSEWYQSQFFAAFLWLNILLTSDMQNEMQIMAAGKRTRDESRYKQF